MKLIVGLGNPGTKYALTRHNVGFMAIDWLAQSLGTPALRKESDFKSLVSQFRWNGVDVLLAQPQTFMNLSGEAVQPMMSYYKIGLDDLMVLQDEVDLAFGQMKVQRNRGHAGQNGIRDITEKLGTPDYTRTRIGVGRPLNPQVNLADHVLQKFSDEELQALPPLFEQIRKQLETSFIKV